MSFDERRSLVALFVDKIIVQPVGRGGGPKFRPERIRISWRA